METCCILFKINFIIIKLLVRVLFIQKILLSSIIWQMDVQFSLISKHSIWKKNSPQRKQILCFCLTFKFLKSCKCLYLHVTYLGVSTEAGNRGSSPASSQIIAAYFPMLNPWVSWVKNKIERNHFSLLSQKNCSWLMRESCTKNNPRNITHYNKHYS